MRKETLPDGRVFFETGTAMGPGVTGAGDAASIPRRSSNDMREDGT